MLKEVILVPRRADDGPRDVLWEWCRTQKWERDQSHMPIFEGHHNEGLFNRSAAVNKAARLAGEWDVAVIIDADVFIDAERLKEAVKIAHETGKVVYPHDVRKDLNRQGNQRVMNGFSGNWERYVHRRYPNMVSSVLVVPRRLWDEIGGFDESFRGWGYEDTAFAAAAATFGHGDIRLPGEVWHLWHPTAKEGKRGTETHMRNSAKGQRYRAAIGNPDAIRALQSEGRTQIPASSGIPRILHRVVPEQRNVQSDEWWARFEELHPDWELMTHRDPLDPEEWPLTAAHWDKVANGAQFADLIRLEALLRFGGVYVDQDVEPLRPLDALLSLSAFAAWEDPRSVPNAVMGATPDHPAVWACLELMIERLPGETWQSGPGVLTEILPNRSDVLLLPPGSFYPYHYKEKERAGEDFRKTQPWAFVAHHWWGSWLEKVA